MTGPDKQLMKQLEKHEAGVSDLLAAYDLAESQYFAAVYGSAPHIEPTIASNSTSWVSDANLG